MTALDRFLTGAMPEGGAVDAMAHATPEQLQEIGRLTERFGDAWSALIARRSA